MNPSWTFTTAVTHGQNWEGIYLNKQEPKQIVFFVAAKNDTKQE